MESPELSAHILQAIEVYTKGTKAWFEDEDDAWVSAQVVSNQVTDSHVKLVFQNDEQPERVSGQKKKSGTRFAIGKKIDSLFSFYFYQWSGTCF
jgi:myosin-5